MQDPVSQATLEDIAEKRDCIVWGAKPWSSCLPSRLLHVRCVLVGSLQPRCAENAENAGVGREVPTAPRLLHPSTAHSSPDFVQPGSCLSISSTSNPMLRMSCTTPAICSLSIPTHGWPRPVAESVHADGMSQLPP